MSASLITPANRSTITNTSSVLTQRTCSSCGHSGRDVTAVMVWSVLEFDFIQRDLCRNARSCWDRRFGASVGPRRENKG
jgi:hypothetical protein